MNLTELLFEQKCKCSKSHLKFGHGPHVTALHVTCYMLHVTVTVTPLIGCDLKFDQEISYSL